MAETAVLVIFSVPGPHALQTQLLVLPSWLRVLK
jgi:hypothetical protein